MNTATQSASTTPPAGVTITPITPADAENWATLMRAIATANNLAWKPSATELVEGLEPTPLFDPARQTWGVWDGQEMIAYAELLTRDEPRHDGLNAVYVNLGVHPGRLGEGIATHLTALAEPLGAELAATFQPGVPFVYNAVVSAEDDPGKGFLAEHGYDPIRHFFEMRNDLAAGYVDDPRTSAITTEHSEAVRRAHNDAFSTHWGSGPSSPERWGQFMKMSTLRLDLSRIIVNEEGTVLAYAIVSSSQPGEAYLELVGTRGTAQGNGYGKAVLTSAVAALRNEGSFSKVELDVDADSPSDAGRLYTNNGFVNFAQATTFSKAGAWDSSQAE